MTAEELYKEFVEVTHINEDFVDHYEKANEVFVKDTMIIKNVECLIVFLKNTTYGGFLTYFHKEDKNDKS